MANLIKIKRSSSTASPVSLGEGELAVSFLSGKLFVGNTTAVIPIGGVHSPGTLTANQALVANSTSGIDKVIVANLNIQELRANASVGTAGFLLASAGAGANAYWINPTSLTTAAAGSNTQIQFNNSGAFGASANFAFDTATSVLTVGNSTVNTTVNSTSITITSGPKANTTGVYPSSNTVSTALGAAAQRWVLNANTIDASGLVTAGASLNVTGTANATVGINVGANVNLTTTNINVGNSTVNTAITSTAIDTDGTLAVLGATTLSNTLSAGNTTVTGFVNASVSVNSAILSVGTALIGNSTGLYHTGTVNAASHTTTGVTANATGVYPSSNTVGTALGLAANRWVLNANTIDASGLVTAGASLNVTGTANATVAINVGANVNLTTSSVGVGNSTVNTVVTSTAVTIASGVIANTTGAYPASNTVATALGSTTQRWNLIANTGSFSGAVNGITTLGAGNTTVTGDLSVTGNTTLGDAATDVVTFNADVNTNIIPSSNGILTLGATTDRWSLFANQVTAVNGSFGGDLTVSGNLTVSGTLTTIDTVNLVIKDPLIKLANNNSADAVDIGFYGVYNDGATKYTGLFRDQSDSGKYKLYVGLTNEPGTVVDLTGGSLAAFVVGALEASSLTLTTPLAVGSGGTGAATFTSKGVIYGNATSALQVTAAGTDGQVLQANSTGFPVFADLDGGTF